MEGLLKERKEKLKKIYLGGGEKSIAKQKEKSKKTKRIIKRPKIGFGGEYILTITDLPN